MIFDFIDILYKGTQYCKDDYIRFANQYINCLHHKKVVVLMRRSPRQLFALLMLLERNCTYVLVDPSYPIKRIEYIIIQTNPDYVMTDKNFIDNSISKSMTMYDDSIAYNLFTSGSTGDPKGVEIKKNSLLNFIDGISEIIDFSPGKRIACLTMASFDIFFLESIMALYKGLTVVLASEDEQRNPALMANLIKDNMIDMVQMTPSRMQLLLNYDKDLSCLQNVKEIMIGGEPFPFYLLRTLQVKTNAKIYNMYGPTETTIWSTVSDLTYKDRIDIGVPIKNTEIYIINESLSILPNGQAGEICIAGKGLAKGYVGREDLTEEKFIYLPEKPSIRVYRTGDMGRYLSDGNLEYLGRIDNQVKIRGHRIELEEIESKFNQLDGIKQSIVTINNINDTNMILQAFYTSDITIHQKVISDYLSSQLPDYMIPAVYKHVENFIQTDNGKIDRKSIFKCVEINTSDSELNDYFLSGLSIIQKKAYDVIISAIDSKIANVTLDSELTSVGIDSVTFIDIVMALEAEFRFEFDDEMMLITVFPTIKSIIEYVESEAILA